MKILIVDDEPLARSRLQDLLNDIGGMEVIGEASNGREALNSIETLKPDLVLLDIHMPEINGLEVAMHLARFEAPPAIIFTTAYDEHALEAFDANAIDYLLKPIRQNRLEQALVKARQLRPEQLQAVARMENSQEHSEGNHQARQHICAHHRGGLKLVPVDEIIFFQSDSKYVVVHHQEGEVLIDDPLKELEQEFADRFTRIHRNALAANACIEALEKDAEGHYQVRLRGTDQILQVSRRQLPGVRKVIAQLGEHATESQQQK